MPFDIDANTVFIGLTGSHAHGTARPSSDVDLRGCCVAPLAQRLSFRAQFEQRTWVGEGEPPAQDLGPNFARALARVGLHPSAGPALADDPAPDLVIFDLAKVLSLCALSNPNMFEMLFLDEREIVFTTPLWEQLRGQRHLFLSQQVRHTYAGYAKGQLRRIRGHREWLLNPPSHPPTRAEFGLPEQSVLSADDRNRIEEAITKQLRAWSVDEGIELPSAERDVLRARMEEFWTATLEAANAPHSAPLSPPTSAPPDQSLEQGMAAVAGARLGLSREVLEILGNERRYRSARRHWDQFCRWQRERNSKRAALEAAHGYDTKHGAHLIRLLRMGVEILRDGQVKVRREDAEELRAIRDGALTYAALIEQAEALELDMRRAVSATSLPPKVDEARLDALLFELLQRHGKD